MTTEAWKPTKEQLAAAAGTTIADVITPDLNALFVGINPSLYSAAVGHHFARPGNRFWPALHAAGITDQIISPFKDQSLMEFGYGITNVVERATARADELSDDELRNGAIKLQKKVKRYRIGAVVFLGVTAYRTAYAKKDATIGRQAEPIGNSPVWVLPNPSGLNAHYQLPDFAKLFKKLHTELSSPE